MKANHLRHAVSVVLVLLALTRVAAASEPRHLYVGAQIILRYALHNGLPDTSPDLTISGFGGPAGIARDGQLYSQPGGKTFDVFRFGASQPYRRLHIHLAPIQYVSSTAVDPHGNFWVEYSYFTADRVRNDRKPIAGALAFAPRAHGEVYPIQTLFRGGSPALAFNSVGDMFFSYVFQNDQSVDELRDVLGHARLRKAYRDSAINDENASIAVNSDDDVFVRTILGNGPYQGIAVFTPGTDPTGPPANVIETTSRSIEGIAAGPRYVYVLDYESNSIQVYFAHKNGPQQPFVSVPLPAQAGGALLAGP